jgi:HK97 family phage prohead protease
MINRTKMKNNEKQYLREIVTEGVHVRESEDKDSRTITGCAIVFDTETVLYSYDDKEYRELILKEAVPKSLLDESDIKMTMFHNRELILARSNKGNGTLRYWLDDKGVYFEFEAPDTVDGDKALALVRSGDLSGCSFAFTIKDWDTYEDIEVRKEDDKTIVLSKIREIESIRDFTIAADPAYPTTEVSARCREVLERETTYKTEPDAPEPAVDRKGEREIASLRLRLAVRNR